MSERSEQEKIRFEKLNELREQGFAYPNKVESLTLSTKVLAAEVKDPPETGDRFRIAGRMVQIRVMGKAAFFHVLDGEGKIQLYVRRDDIGAENYQQFKRYDIGDIIEASGYLFTTKTGEKTLHVESLRLLAKSLIPLPEKWHGLTDVEIRYRRRYVDLIANPDVRELFKTRAKIIREIRAFLDARDYVEVETPVLHQIPGGAAARPFGSYYNAISTDVFMRIALELPLKKLIVGGLDRVYEIGRCFRNEGLSKKHNPEFTMIEFYQAYANFEEMMELTEELISGLVEKITGSTTINYGDKEINFARPWKKLSMSEAIHELGGVDRSVDLNSLDSLVQLASKHHVELSDARDWGRCLEAVFEALVEDKLVNPTFIMHHPYSISPLARKNDEDPKITDRFELFISGMEVANAFSELNDPVDQRERFELQAMRKAQGDDEAQEVDDDYLTAMEYGMPPTGGEGIGIDRLVMLLTNSPTIRDVLLFPQLKPLAENVVVEEVDGVVNE